MEIRIVVEEFRDKAQIVRVELDGHECIIGRRNLTSWSPIGLGPRVTELIADVAPKDS